jgi:8-oxo-dGTP diphosphatase
LTVSTQPIDVAVGILIRDDGAFLLAQRPHGKPMAGYWEFPGGKLEIGETVFDALVREFDEELDLHIVEAHPWVQRVVVYPHATVRLHFWRSFGEGRGWKGEPHGNEAQAFRWEHIDRPTTDPWLAGAQPVKRWMQLPATYAISNAREVGIDRFIARLDAKLADGAIAQLQLREPTMDASAFASLFDAVRARCAAHRVRLLVNSVHDEGYWTKANGVHLTARDLMRRDERPQVDWCFASCHDAKELAHAGRLSLDAAVLGPVHRTASHVGVEGIGWPAFTAIASATTIPVYAIGGLQASDMRDAIGAGAHGIAMIRAAWSSVLSR